MLDVSKIKLLYIFGDLFFLLLNLNVEFYFFNFHENLNNFFYKWIAFVFKLLYFTNTFLKRMISLETFFKTDKNYKTPIKLRVGSSTERVS
jgi:hypothetical protein